MARYRARIKFWPSLSMALILALFLQLSSWQWHRYHEKLHLQRTYQAASITPEVPLTQALASIPLQAKDNVFLSIAASGHYDPLHQIVLDNRSMGGQPGYEIFTPLLLDTKPATAILIDRGFIPVGQHWQSLPDLTPPSGQVTLKGFLSQAQHNFILGAAIEASLKPWPLRVARIDFNLLQKHYSYPLVPYVIHLKPKQAGSYLCQWSYPQLFAERSLGYTFQWLALAAATLVLWAIISFKRE